MSNISGSRPQFEKLRRELDIALHLLNRRLDNISDHLYDSLPNDIKEVFQGLYVQTQKISIMSDELRRLSFPLTKSDNFKDWNPIKEPMPRHKHRKMHQKCGEKERRKQRSSKPSQIKNNWPKYDKKAQQLEPSIKLKVNKANVAAPEKIIILDLAKEVKGSSYSEMMVNSIPIISENDISANPECITKDLQPRSEEVKFVQNEVQPLSDNTRIESSNSLAKKGLSSELVLESEGTDTNQIKEEEVIKVEHTSTRSDPPLSKSKLSDEQSESDSEGLSEEEEEEESKASLSNKSKTETEKSQISPGTSDQVWEVCDNKRDFRSISNSNKIAEYFPHLRWGHHFHVECLKDNLLPKVHYYKAMYLCVSKGWKAAIKSTVLCSILEGTPKAIVYLVSKALYNLNVKWKKTPCLCCKWDKLIFLKAKDRRKCECGKTLFDYKKMITIMFPRGGHAKKKISIVDKAKMSQVEKHLTKLYDHNLARFKIKQ